MLDALLAVRVRGEDRAPVVQLNGLGFWDGVIDARIKSSLETEVSIVKRARCWAKDSTRNVGSAAVVDATASWETS